MNSTDLLIDDSKNIGDTMICRKLGMLEKSFHGSSDKAPNYVYKNLLITSGIDLYEHLNVVKAAIREWKNNNPILRCIVVKKKDKDDSESE